MKKGLPPNHPYLAVSYNNLGLTYWDKGEYLKALSLHEKSLSFHENALKIRQYVLPERHPDLAQSYYNIGLVYKEPGNTVEALSYFARAVDIAEYSLPSNHLNIQLYKNDLGYMRTVS
ncbi:unnamed protein product [Rotaria magnacalcarata]|uniref:Uncharacterized protein n=1 Tax=Rotaria magnacalcarata TaxID=392030 RepID=A0A816XRZ2_9BILA|nr:unnamed protein product [Rotaria magnacalcarata]